MIFSRRTVWTAASYVGCFWMPLGQIVRRKKWYQTLCTAEKSQHLPQENDVFPNVPEASRKYERKNGRYKVV